MGVVELCWCSVDVFALWLLLVCGVALWFVIGFCGCVIVYVVG